MALLVGKTDLFSNKIVILYMYIINTIMSVCMRYKLNGT